MDPQLLARCEKCGQQRSSWAVQPCPICNTPVCQKCAHLAYGRLFCSPRCGAYFFHGDADDEDSTAES